MWMSADSLSTLHIWTSRAIKYKYTLNSGPRKFCEAEKKHPKFWIQASMSMDMAMAAAECSLALIKPGANVVTSDN